MGAPLGNSNRATQYRIKRTLEAILGEASSKQDGATKLEMACRAIVGKAEDGDLMAFREVADRTEGKPPQSIDLGSDPDRPVVQKVVREIVRPADKDG